MQRLLRLVGSRPSHLSEVFEPSLYLLSPTALERTFLVYVRLGLVLIIISGSILCQLRFPGSSGSVSHLPTSQALPLGILYGLASLATLALGCLWYEHCIGESGLRGGKAFIDGDLSYEPAVPSLLGQY